MNMNAILQKLELQGDIASGQSTELMEKVAQVDMEKEAFKMPGVVKQYGGPILKQTAITGSALGVLGALTAGKDAAADALNTIRRGADYRNMMNEWGNSAGLSRMDSRLVRKSYDTVHQLSPTIARKPMIVGPIIRDMMIHSQNDPGKVQLELGQAEKLMKIETQSARELPSAASQVVKSVATNTAPLPLKDALNLAEASPDQEQMLRRMGHPAAHHLG
jgi:hypothetical protein